MINRKVLYGYQIQKRHVGNRAGGAADRQYGLYAL